MVRTAGWTSSTEIGAGRAPTASRRAVVGRIRGAHGLRGQVRVQVFSDASVLLALENVTLGSDEEDPDAVTYAVESAAPGREDEVRMRLAGVRRRD